tara:strand:+ start:601 stop:993 length:393 start_codon:yes stop_codon:yes gene_type:complete
MYALQKKKDWLSSSINAQKIKSKIANKEKLSQSKVVGIPVEEALTARHGLHPQYSNHKISKENIVYNSSFNNNDIDELISDKGITYNTKTYNYNSDISRSEIKEGFNEELFEQFKQFVLFQKWHSKNKLQ